jgi:chromosome segregation ATPase
MYKTKLTLAAITMLGGLLFNGCQSADEKVASAQARVETANENLATAQNNADSAAQKAASTEEWAIFRNDAEAKIKGNEIRIAALKMKMKKTSNQFDTAYANRVDTLENRNKAMQERIDAYAKKQDAWASFKLEFNTNMGELANALDDLSHKPKQ